ncbi:class II aldolase/adducin family protein [Puniceicoccus vermicola]|uniref:L-ribulose-5-phosphate 4-epimerase n=1 Tax=Puniceicoccus vermicola TaxID=388746 RepID=A0A7X1E4A9_9BACT|nr:class II aldolase/adducin family protein [Puniceicoccus vermicola]MBC2601941.1 class II aldolase/adducin family protein [Puniceicoccus vermicola]
MLENLRFEVHEATTQLVENGLVDYFRGNISAFDPRRGLVVIKPRGIDYGKLTPESYLVVSARTGQVVEGLGMPATGIDAHLTLYRDLPDIRSIVGTHSKYATMWAQAGRRIPCLGVAHADFFQGEIPITAPNSDGIDESSYYERVGEQIVNHYERTKEDPSLVPAILVDRLGPVTWGASPMDAARNAVYVELLAELAYGTLVLNPTREPLRDGDIQRHFTIMRKRGVIPSNRIRGRQIEKR